MLNSHTHTERGQLKLYSRTVRNSNALPVTQGLVLLFILDRTIGWQKVFETISVGEFARGSFRRKSGRRFKIAPGTGLSSKEVVAAISDLREIGAIEVSNVGSKTAYRVAEDWCHPDLQHAGMWRLNESDYVYSADRGDQA